MPARQPAKLKTAAGRTVAVEPVKAAAAQPGFFASIGKYRKTLAAIVGTVLTWATAALGPDTHISTAEWVALGVAVATALGVYVSPNEPLEEGDAGASPLGVILFVCAVLIILAGGIAFNHLFLLLLILALALLLL